MILHIAPGDPTATYFNPNIPPEVLDQMRTSMGLDRPLHVQYVSWIKAFLTGDFGYSYTQFRPVAEVIGDALPNTLLLGGVSLVVIFLFGCAIGTVDLPEVV